MEDKDAKGSKLIQTGIAGIEYLHTAQDIVVYSQFPLRNLNSALIQGDPKQCNIIVNHFVDKDITPLQMMQNIQTLQNKYSLPSSATVFITAVKMKKALIDSFNIGPIHCFLIVTAGITNLASPLDPAENLYLLKEDLNEPPFGTRIPTLGTINTIFLLDASLSPQVFGNLFIILTEAKCAVFQQYHITTRFDEQATGTTSDAIGIFSSARNHLVHWSGYSTEFGHNIGSHFMNALISALKIGGYI